MECHIREEKREKRVKELHGCQVNQISLFFFSTTSNTFLRSLPRNSMQRKMFNSLVLFILFFFPFCGAIDSLTPNQSIEDGQYLVSKEKNFELGFFSPGNSSNRYLGIRFFKVKEQTLVWVANRNDPINGSAGSVLSIDQRGNLVLYDNYNRSRWSTNVSIRGTTSTVAQLLDTGNLVLVDRDDNKTILWQSFDYPTDTSLQGMKLGLNRKTGLDRFLISWNSENDPGTGDYLYKVNPTGSPQFFLYNDSTPYRRSWPWPWPCSLAKTKTLDYKTNLVYNQDEISYTYSLDDPSFITRLVLQSSGILQLLEWDDGDLKWTELWSAPRYRCEAYGLCGPYSTCSPDNFNKFECTCLPGYEPKSPRNWYLRNGSDGCVRKQMGLPMCGNGEGFVNVGRLKVPDTTDAVWVGMSMSSAECEKACLMNCSCTAYVSLDINGTGTGCLAYYGKLVDGSVNTDEGWDLNLRVDAAELGTLLFFHFLKFSVLFFSFLGSRFTFFSSAMYKRKSKDFLGKNRKLVIAVLSVAVPFFLVSLFACIWLLKKRKTKGN
jgi:hypothetical protein